jgi:hypothetical protein
MPDSNESLFRRLTQLFRSGPVIRRRVKSYQGGTKVSSAFEVFRKTQSHVYSTAMSAYGTYDRMARYSDFSEMEYTPEISSALDIYAEETVATDENNQVLHIHSENAKIKKLLQELFFDVLNVEFNLSAWVRNLCKYGDFFLFNDVSPEYGIINVYPIPVNEMEREEGFDPKDPMAVRFRWVTQGNQVLENWQITHFRLLGNDAFLPYGSSVLESARRIWRQLILAEDAMLVYRVVRSPERRVFYVDVGNVPPEEIPNYMEQVQSTLKKSQVVDKKTGRVDLRYNPLSVDEDYYLPVRGAESGTKIDTLPGGANATAVEDIEYIQKKLFASLKIPKAYLGYDEGLGAKATLSQEDIRFSRTINRIQRVVISELNKMAIVHLYSHGFESSDLLDFELQLSNPSTVAQQQKLELFRTRFEIAAAPPEGLVSRKFIRKNILGLTDKQILDIEEQKIIDKEMDLTVESVKLPEGEGGEGGGDDMGTEDLGGGEDFGGEELAQGDSRNTERKPLLIANEPLREIDHDSDVVKFSLTDEQAPIIAQSTVDKITKTLYEATAGHDDEDDSDADLDEEETRSEYNRRRRRRKKWHSGINVSHDPKDKSDSVANPDGMKNLSYEMSHKDTVNPLKGLSLTEESFIENFLDKKITKQASMTSELRSTLKSLESRINIPGKEVLTEVDINISESEN